MLIRSELRSTLIRRYRTCSGELGRSECKNVCYGYRGIHLASLVNANLICSTCRISKR